MRKNKQKYFLCILVCIFSYGVWTIQTDKQLNIQSNDLKNNTGHKQNVTLHSKPFWEECHLESEHVGWVFAIIYLFCIIITFVGLALVCDDYFVPSLEALSSMLNLSEDVAGATLMAAGSSAPELFTSLAAAGVTSDVGVGTIVGSAVFNILIIVSLTGLLSGQNQAMQLDWKPLVRDCIFYCASISIFIAFAWDAKFTWYEALIMLALYACYIMLMFVNYWLMIGLEWLEKSLEELIKLPYRLYKNRKRRNEIEPSRDDEVNHKPYEAIAEISKLGANLAIEIQSSKVSISDSLKEYRAKHNNKRRYTHHNTNLFHTGNHENANIIRRHGSHTSIIRANAQQDRKASQVSNKITEEQYYTKMNENNAAENQEKNIKVREIMPYNSEEGMELPEAISKEDLEEITNESTEIDLNDEEEETLPDIVEGPPSLKDARGKGPLGWIKYIIRWIIYVPSLPFSILFAWSIPNSHYHRQKYMILGSFLMSIVWIAILSFVIVILVGRSGCILGINEFTMGLIVVASGTSIPDALSSVLVARDGYGDMAISNAIGSNIFDLDLGLGLPFLIGIIMNGFRPIILYEGQTDIPILPHAKFGFILLLILIIVVVLLTACKFRLGKPIGVCLIVIYLLFVAYAMIQEFLCKGIYC